MEVIITKITDGKLTRPASVQIKDFMSKHEGKHIEIILKKARSKRSNQQNRFYHGCVVAIVRQAFKDLGYLMSPDEVHEFLKDKFLDYEEMVNTDGELIGKKYKSTTEMSKTEFCDYVARIQIWSAEILNTVIPDPNTSEQLF